MRFLLAGLMILVAFASAPNSYSEDRVQLEITVSPNEPTNFQPADKAKKPAVIVIKAHGLAPDIDAVLRLRITHIKGRGLINTGYPHMEGKHVFAGELPMRNGQASLDYIFPIRGNYLVEADLQRIPSTRIARGYLFAHAREPFFEIRNSIILLSLLFIFGLYLGRIYGSASHGVTQ